MNAVLIPLQCHICAEPSRELCVWCTKDACALHLCPNCRRCSDCCGCEVPLDARRAPEASADPL